MMDSIANEVTQIIDMIAGKLGVAAEKVYPMLLNQAQVFCSTYHVTLWIGGIAVVLFLVALYVFSRTYDWYEEAPAIISGVAMFIFIIVIIIDGVIALSDLTYYLTATHNPEWWAIEYVTKLLK